MMSGGTPVTISEFPSKDGIVKPSTASQLKTSAPPGGGFSFFQTVRSKRKSEDVPLNTGVFSQEDIAEANRRQYGWSNKFSSVYTNIGRFPETVIGRLTWDQSTHQDHLS
jgi:hypothetical protein